MHVFQDLEPALIVGMDEEEATEAAAMVAMEVETPSTVRTTVQGEAASENTGVSLEEAVGAAREAAFMEEV
jgi:hypothetical protein